MLEVQEACNFVTVWNDGTLEELQQIIDKYKKLGFNRVWNGVYNSTLCIHKMQENDADNT